MADPAGSTRDKSGNLYDKNGKLIRWYDPGLRTPPSELSSEGQQDYNAPNEMGGYRKGGKVKKTGPAKVHKGEQVVKKSSAQKYGASKMAAVNRGTAKITARRKK